MYVFWDITQTWNIKKYLINVNYIILKLEMQETI